MKMFKLKELIFVALTVALMFAIAYFLVPLMGMLPLPAYRALLVAPIYGGGVYLAVGRTRKFGTVTLIGTIIGVILSVFSILMLFVSIISGLLTDLACGLPFRGYEKHRNCLVAAGLFPAIQIPLVFYSMAYTLGGSMAELISKPIVIIIPTLLTFVLGYLTARGVSSTLRKRKLQEQL